MEGHVEGALGMGTQVLGKITKTGRNIIGRQKGRAKYSKREDTQHQACLKSLLVNTLICVYLRHIHTVSYVFLCMYI